VTLLPILQVVPLGPHEEGSFITVAHPPYVHLSGLALNCKKDEATFTLDIDLWVSSLIKTEQKPARRASAPFLCHIADSPKYKNSTKPTPYEKRFVTVHGYITGVIYNNPQDSDQGIERYIITVKLIDFLGGLAEPSGGKEGSVIPNKLDSKQYLFFLQFVHMFMGCILLASTPRKGFGSFRYGSNSKSPLTTGMQPPSTPTLNGSGLLSNKRRRVGDDKSLAGTPDPEPSLGQSEKASETDEKGKKRAT